MPRASYTCECCGTVFDTFENAAKCENAHARFLVVGPNTDKNLELNFSYMKGHKYPDSFNVCDPDEEFTLTYVLREY
jgi:proteasome lid subunit RPN8/RPN11